MAKLLFNVLFILLISSQIPRGNTQIIAALEVIGLVVDIIANVINVVNEFKPTDSTDNNDDGNTNDGFDTETNEIIQGKLGDLSDQLKELQNQMLDDFNQLFTKIDDLPNKVHLLETKDKIENDLLDMEHVYEELILKQRDFNNGKIEFHKSDAILATDYEDRLEKSWNNMRDYLLTEHYDMTNFYKTLMKVENVCEAHLSNLQLLNRFRIHYVSISTRYVLSRHIIFNILEYLDKQDYTDNRMEFNHQFFNQIVGDIEKFKLILKGASSKYTNCGTDDSYYEFLTILVGKKPCYFTNGTDEIAFVDPVMETKITVPCVNYISLRPVLAKSGYVVVGVKFATKSNIVYLQIKQAKLLPNGRIDLNTIAEEQDFSHGIGDKVAEMDMGLEFDLTQKIIPDDYVVTGFRVANENKKLTLKVISTKIDMAEARFYNSTTSERNLKEKIRNKPSSTKVYLRSKAHIEPLIDTRFVEPHPTPLSGAGFHLTYDNDGNTFLQLKVWTYNIVPHIKVAKFNVNETFKNITKHI